MAANSPSEPLPAGLCEALAGPEALGSRGPVAWVQTHLSHVFLTPSRAIKLHKAADLGFVSFANRAERNADALRELRLNRRLAPDVYLGIAPVLPERGSFRLGELEPDPRALDPEREHCVVMRRLPDGHDALSLLERGELQPQQLERAAECIARFHDQHGLGSPAPFDPATWQERIAAPIRANFESLQAHADSEALPALLALATAAEAALASRRDDLERRRLQGRAVDGHGDLHLQHIWFERAGAEPLVLDCIAFSESLRRIDAASDIAFLAMDLAYRHRRDLGERVLRHYAGLRDDFDLYRVVDLYIHYRAAVRAKVAGLAADDPTIPEPQRARARESVVRHLALARESLETPAPGALVLVGGAVGSGKSSGAALVAERLGGVVISSDRVRKRLHGLAPEDRAGGEVDTGIYSREATEGVYAGLLERAAAVAASGRLAVLDATWSRRAHRQRARSMAARLGTDALFVEMCCPEDIARERLARRAAAGSDPSDAGPEFLAESLKRFEAPDEWPEPERVRIESHRDDWRDELETKLRSALSACRA